MDPVQALAILSLGAFVTVLVTAVFYIVSVRPRLLEPVPLEAVGVLDETLRTELAEQRAVVAQLNTALTHHSQALESATTRTTADSEAVDALRGMLHAQNEAVQSMTGLLNEHSTRLTGLDERLGRQETALSQTAERIANITDATLPGLVTQITGQDDKLSRLEGRFDGLASADAVAQKRASGRWMVVSAIWQRGQVTSNWRR
jgi:uncharacterized coiled-coil protein SlyX